LHALWEPSPLYWAEVPQWGPPEPVSQQVVWAKPSGRAGGGKKPSSPAKEKRLPISKKPAGKPAKPAGAVKPRRISKPSPAGKPTGGAKSPGALKLAKPGPLAKPKRGRSPRRRAELRPVDERSPGTTVTCSIFGWRDAEGADFYAVAFGLQGRDWIVERSPRFLWPSGDFPDEAYEAHATLVEALVRAGWRPTGYEGAWYRQSFERAIDPVSKRS
jgi:hypothetical protein